MALSKSCLLHRGTQAAGSSRKAGRPNVIKDCKAAAREAREEAGVKGKILREAIGTYRYIKRELGNGALIEVRVFLLKVSKRCKRWPEKRERRRAWFDIEDAASRVSDPELSILIALLQEKNGDGGRFPCMT